MKTTISSELYRAALMTFEQLGFLSPEEPADSLPDDSEHDCTARVAFEGAASGELIVCSYGMILHELASNMLGTTDATTVHQRQDAAAEAANVVCGNLLPHIAGTEAVFNLNAPFIESESPEPGQPDAVADLNFAEGRIVLQLHLHQADSPVWAPEVQQ